MSATSFTAGSEGKGDCRVSASLEGPPDIVVETKSAELLERGIAAVAAETLDALDAHDVRLVLSVDGALDYVIRARVEAAVRGLREMAPLQSPVVRVRSEKDRPRRSRLYAPGNQPRLLVGIDLYGADCVLLDLEDSVPLAEKASARILVKHVLAAVPFPEDVWVRINPLDSGGLDDVAEVLIGRPHGVCLPKAESAEDVCALSRALADVETALDLDVGATWIMPILETSAGILHAEEIAAADGRVAMVAFGAEDYTRDIGALRSRRSLLFARSQLIAAAKAAGVQASDTVFSDLEDEEGLAEEAALARELGFDGKGAINPRQLPAIHAAFTPTDEELDHAKAVVQAADEAEAQGLGAVSLNGRMIDRPVLERAQRLMRYAAKLSGGGQNA